MKTVLIFIIILLVPGVFAQRAGDLYTEFAEGGIYMENRDDTLIRAYDMGVLPDNNLIIAGNYENDITDADQIYVKKLDNTGNPCSFGNFVHGFEYSITDQERAEEVIVLPDGKILIAGYYYFDTQCFPFILRLQPNGQLDTGFGINGIYTENTYQMRVCSMDIYRVNDSYNIILYGLNVDKAQFMMIDADGTLVTSFGSDGIVRSNDFMNHQRCDMAIDSENNDLYVSGSTPEGYSVLGKYNLPNGIPDNDFGTNGLLIFSDYSNSINAIVYNKIEHTLTAFGQFINIDNLDIFAHRVNGADGSADLSFGIQGWSTLASAASDEFIYDAVMQSDNKYYFSGTTDINGDYDYLLARMDAYGFTDTSFGENGFVITNIGLSDEAYSIALGPTEEILYAAGFSKNSEVMNLTTAAYHTGYKSEPSATYNITQINSLTCYPNPASGVITIETGKIGLHQIQIVDLTGKELLNEYFSGVWLERDISFLQPAVYLIRITLPDKQVMVKKLVKN